MTTFSLLTAVATRTVKTIKNSLNVFERERENLLQNGIITICLF